MVKRVLKFGGTSVGTVERIQHLPTLLKEHATGNKVIVVVSAMAGKTNELLKYSRNFKSLIKGVRRSFIF